MSTLYIVEKGSHVQALRDALAKNNMNSGVKIVPLSGHIMELYDFGDYDKDLNDSWVNLVIDKKVPFFPKELKKKVKKNSSFVQNGKKLTNDYKKKFQVVKESIESANKIILATDPDNEGATLALEVIERCNAMNKIAGMIDMSKLDIHTLSKEVKVTNKLPYLKMYDCGDSRAYYDQMFGFNMSIIATIALGKGKTLQVGGVKLPTIRMVVERDLAFESHKEVPFWSIRAKAEHEGKVFDIDIYRENEEGETKFEKESDAQRVKEIVEAQLQAKVVEHKEQIKKQAPPKPYSLTELQGETSKRFKLSGDDTLKIAQKLYIEDKVQSYPRVDTNYYSDGEHENATQILTQLGEIQDFKALISNIKDISNPIKRNVFDSSKVEIHTALAPTLDADKAHFGKLDGLDKKVFELVVVRYIAQFLEDYKYLDIRGSGVIQDDIMFKYGEKAPVELGWKITTNTQVTERTIPNISQSDSISIHKDSISIVKGTTKPKPRFKEDTLLMAMKNIASFYDDEKIKAQLGKKGADGKPKGIGTPATRASILSDLKTARKNDEPYFKVDKNENIISTQKARDLIKTLPDYISSPILRAEMEAKLDDIMKESLTKQEFFKEVEKIVNEINEEVKKVGEIPTQKQAKKEVEELDIKCPLCDANLVDVGMLFKCSKQKFANGKASGCKFKIFKNSKPMGRDLTIEDINALLAGESLEGSSGTITFNKDNPFFTDVEWKNGGDNKNSSTNPNELIETAKTFRLGDKMVFKDFRGKALTKKQAEELLNGKAVKLKRKSKAGSDYTVQAKLLDEKGKLDVQFV